MDNIEQLKKFGLSEKEAKVYLACLNLGDSLASEIALKSNLPRTLIYDLLERLIDFGLISYSIKNNKKYFLASDPKELMRIAKEKEEAIKLIMPNLEILQKITGTNRPKIEIYEGIEGMKAVMNELLKEGKEIYGYGSSRSSYGIIPAFMDEWHKERIEKKIIMNLIYNNTDETRKRIKESPKSLKLLNYKLMPIKIELPTATVICGNKVFLQSWTKEPFAVVIESKEMADNQKKYFEALWKMAKKAI